MRRYIISMPLMLVLLAAGCANPPSHTTRGAVGGGALGATAGGIIGHQSGRGLEGAAIGAGLGAVTGGMLGRRADTQAAASDTRVPDTRVPAETRTRDEVYIAPIPLSEIAQMANNGRTNSEIISEIQRTRSIYRLNMEDINYLKTNKVSDEVVDYMLSTGR